MNPPWHALLQCCRIVIKVTVFHMGLICYGSDMQTRPINTIQEDKAFWYWMENSSRATASNANRKRFLGLKSFIEKGYFWTSAQKNGLPAPPGFVPSIINACLYNYCCPISTFCSVWNKRIHYMDVGEDFLIHGRDKDSSRTGSLPSYHLLMYCPQTQSVSIKDV